MVKAKSARGMPLEYEMMGRPIDEMPDCRVTWLPSQSRIRMVLPKSCLQRLVAGLAEHRSRDFRKVMRRAALQTNTGVTNDQILSKMSGTRLPPVTPSPKKKQSDDGEIHLIGRGMKCKNNRWTKAGDAGADQKSPSDDGGESSRGGSCPETDVSWERFDASGGGDSGRLSTPIDTPGEGEFVLFRDIFSLRFCSREISAFKPCIFFCNCWFNFSSCTIWFVALSKRDTLLLF